MTKFLVRLISGSMLVGLSSYFLFLTGEQLWAVGVAMGIAWLVWSISVGEQPNGDTK